MIRIGIDVDNVLADFSTLFLKEFYKCTGEQLRQEDLFDWNFKQVIDQHFKGRIDSELANQIILASSFVAELELFDGVEDSLKKLCTHPSVEVVIVTALAEELKDIRIAWLDTWFKACNYQLIFESKKERVPLDYLIDDGLHNLDAVSAHLPIEHCICLAQPYNQRTHYPRFESLEAAINYVLDREKLNLI